MRIAGLSAAVVAVCAAWSGAAVVGTTGAVATAPLPASLVQGAMESNTTAWIMFERERVLNQPVEVDITSAGVFDQLADLTPGAIAAGTRVRSYILHADPVGSSVRTYEGTVRFDEVVIGIIVRGTRLAATDSLLGGIGTTYDGASEGRGLELNQAGTADEVSLSMTPDRRIVGIRWTASTATDEIRILTIPGPGTAGVTLLGVIAVARRRR